MPDLVTALEGAATTRAGVPVAAPPAAGAGAKKQPTSGRRSRWILGGGLLAALAVGLARIIAQQTTLLGESRDTASSRSGNEARARRVATSPGATKMVTGSYRVVSDSIEFLIQIIDARSGSLDRAIAPVRGPKSDPTVVAERVRERALGGLALVLDAPARSSLIGGTGVAPKYEAYREYMKAVDLTNRERLHEADSAARRAHQLDPTFLQPLFVVAETYGVKGMREQADSVLDVLERHSKNLSPVDQTMLSFIRAELAGDFEACLRWAQRLDELAPGDETKLLIGQVHLALNRPEAAWLALGAVRDPTQALMRENHDYWALATLVLHRLGRDAEALTVAHRARQALPVSSSVRQLELTQLAALGRPAAVDSGIEEIQGSRRSKTGERWGS